MNLHLIIGRMRYTGLVLVDLLVDLLDPTTVYLVLSLYPLAGVSAEARVLELGVGPTHLCSLAVAS